MKMLKGKTMNLEYGNSSASTSSMGHACISFCTYSFALTTHNSLEMKQDWVVDTGASDHMSPHIDLFHDIHTLDNPITVNLPDGTSKLVTTIGKIKLSPILIPTKVFHVPEFKFNLLSVGKLLIDNQLLANFSSFLVCFSGPFS